jgi:hypothetical protein
MKNRACTGISVADLAEGGEVFALVSRGMRTRALPFLLLLVASPAFGDEPGEGAPEADEVEEKGKHPEHSWEANADFVYGTSRFETLGPSGTNGSTFDTSRVSVFSFLFGLEREIGEHWIVGARIPLIAGAPDTIQSRGEGDLPPRTVGAQLGNLELEGLYKHEILKNKAMTATFESALEIALPISPGTEPPAQSDFERSAMYPYGSLDRYALAQAAAFTRGSLDTALFAPNRFGVVPKLSTPLHFLNGKLKVRPTVKLEALFDTTGKSREPAIGELVMGLRASYEIVTWLEPGVHAWTNITITNSEEKDLTIAALEPSVYGHFGPVSPYVGVIIPIAGRLVTQDTLACRLGVAMGF